MKRMCMAVPYLAVVWGLVGPANGGPLALVSGGSRFHLGWRIVDVTDRPAEILTKQPAYRTPNPVYLALRLGNASDAVITGVLDESGGPGAGYDTLYLDANNNGDLTDDPKPRVSVRREGPALSFEIAPVDVRVKYSGETSRVLRVAMELCGHAAGSATIRWSAGCQAAQHLEGRADFGSRTNVLVGIYDTSGGETPGNGCFDDYGTDRLRLDLDGDGALDPDREDVPLSKVIRVDGRLWEIALGPGANRLDVSPCRRPTGRATFRWRFPEGRRPVEGTIEVNSAAQGIAMEGPIADGETLELPEGEYRVSQARVVLAEKTGERWEALFSLPAPFPVRAQADAGVSLDAFGAPLRLEPKIQGILKPGQSVCIMPHLVGIGGEEYRNIGPLKTRLVPELTITDANAIEILRARMEYG